MSEIPYFFDTPVPRYFRDNGWMTNPNMAAFLVWTFSRCHLEKKVIYKNHKAVELEPFEFIFGRQVCSLETGLSERNIRTCICQLNDTPIGEILKKSTSKTTSKFSVYRYSTKVFMKNTDQQFDQQPTSNRPATDHNKRTKKADEQEFVKETIKESPKPASLPSFASLPLSHKAKEEYRVSSEAIEGISAYLSSVNQHIDTPIIKRWLKTYGEERVVQNICHVLEKGKFRIFGAAVEDSCKNDYARQKQNMISNRSYAIELKNKNNISSLKINKTYCVDPYGNDYQFSLDPSQFRKMLEEKLI